MECGKARKGLRELHIFEKKGLVLGLTNKDRAEGDVRREVRNTSWLSKVEEKEERELESGTR